MADDIETTIANERTKLLAAAIDRAATTLFTVGVATPLATVILYNQSPLPVPFLFTVVGVCLVLMTILHLEARRALGSLK